MTETQLYSLTHVGEVLHFLNDQTRLLFDHYALAKFMFQFYNLTRSHIDNLRSKYAPIIDSETFEMERKREAMREKFQLKGSDETTGLISAKIVQPPIVKK